MISKNKNMTPLGRQRSFIRIFSPQFLKKKILRLRGVLHYQLGSEPLQILKRIRSLNK